MYAQMIREELARQGRIGMSPRLVEGWMRLERGTLDSLDRRAFAREVREAAACVEADPKASEQLAQSFGLREELSQ